MINFVGSQEVKGKDGVETEVYVKAGSKRACKSPCYSVRKVKGARSRKTFPRDLGAGAAGSMNGKAADEG